MKQCDLCHEEKPLTHQVKLDSIEPEQGNKLLFCEDCSEAVSQVEGGLAGFKLTKIEELASLLWAVTGFTLEEYSCPASCCPNCEDEHKCPDAR